MRLYPKIFLVLLISALLLSPAAAPEADAMEPISISLLAAALAPIVLPYVIKALPYVWKGFVNFSSAMMDVLAETFRTGYIALGTGKVLLGWPFGLFKSGLIDLMDGFAAPFKACFAVCMIPLKTIGMGLN
ncbi:MAG: hypothetical protein JW808_10350 [Victivallales bacterium]|nr:hypothetical protein [Victivallales bacterium]